MKSSYTELFMHFFSTSFHSATLKGPVSLLGGAARSIIPECSRVHGLHGINPLASNLAIEDLAQRGEIPRSTTMSFLFS